MQVAHAARALARLSTDQRMEPNEAYAYGLLHDIGRFVMFQEAPEQLRGVDESAWETPKDLRQREREICGLTHTEIGASACTKFGLPEIFAIVAGHHHDHDPTEDLILSDAQYCRLIALADLAMFASSIPGGLGLDRVHSDESLEVFLRPRMIESIDASGGELRRLIADSTAQAEEACNALGV